MEIRDYGPARTDDVIPPVPLPETYPPLTMPRQRGGPDEPLLPVQINPWIGPAGGITLDEAIDLMLRNNLELKVSFSEIPQADADALTASLRANPIVFADAQQVPYGAFNPSNASGPIQFDVNFVHPLDLTGKRRTRIASARMARRAVEAKYQDVVRLQIDNVSRAFVDALVAQRNYDLARGAGGNDAAAVFSFDEAEGALKQARRTLAYLLGVPTEMIVDRQLAGQVLYTCSDRDLPHLPPELVRMALECRPDLIAQRLNVARAEADVRASQANRLDDLQLLVQPYTFHDGKPVDQRNNTAWALGVTAPMPIYNRQQGNILKARLIASQMRTQLVAMEKAVILEVESAVIEHETAYKAYVRTREDLSDPVLTLKVQAARLPGEDRAQIRRLVGIIGKLQDELDNERGQKFGEAITRHRKSMLLINTAVGQAVMP